MAMNVEKGGGRGSPLFGSKNSHNLHHFDISVSPSSHPSTKIAVTSSTQSIFKTSFGNSKSSLGETTSAL